MQPQERRRGRLLPAAHRSSGVECTEIDQTRCVLPNVPSGEQACEGHGYGKRQCEEVGCCQFAECPIGDGSGECHSAVGQAQCTPVEFTSHIEDLGPGVCPVATCPAATFDNGEGSHSNPNPNPALSPSPSPPPSPPPRPPLSPTPSSTPGPTPNQVRARPPRQCASRASSCSLRATAATARTYPRLRADRVRRAGGVRRPSPHWLGHVGPDRLNTLPLPLPHRPLLLPVPLPLPLTPTLNTPTLTLTLSLTLTLTLTRSAPAGGWCVVSRRAAPGIRAPTGSGARTPTA